jgi:hypothetical protein
MSSSTTESWLLWRIHSLISDGNKEPSCSRKTRNMESTASAGQKGTRRNPNPSRPCWHSPEQTARLCPTDRVLPPAEALPGLPQGSHWWELSFRADLGESSELKTLGLHSAHCSGPMGKFLYASSTVRIRGCGSAEWHRGGSR